ncbi:MAG: tRNA guanosine(34) transglycosylase Tgt [Parcubacteria group bacterium]
MSFRINKKDKDTKARIGVLETSHGKVATPCFLPIGTKGSVKSLNNDELHNLGAEMILSNTYHLWESPGDELIRKAGGLHRFMNWDRPIFTDSGGYQVFSLGEKAVKKGSNPFNVRVSDKGVSFQSGIDGRKMQLTPKLSVQIQSNLGSDVTVVLDQFTGEIENYDKVKETVRRTTLWAKKSKKELGKLIADDVVNPGQLQLGIVQGGMIEDLRKQSAEEVREIGFDGYCIGGVAVGGESSEMQYKAIEMSLPHLEEEKFKHLFGVGTPEQIIQAVARGMDSFDCVIPTREARHGRLYIFKDDSYETIDVGKSEYKESFKPMDANCNCYACTNHTSAYMHHLYKSGELLYMRLATLHNLNFYLTLMKKIRDSIEEGKFDKLINTYAQISI